MIRRVTYHSASLIAEMFALLRWSLLDPESFRLALEQGRVRLDRARWEGLVIAIVVPVVGYLLLWGLAPQFRLVFAPADARDLARLTLAFASLLCLVGSVTEGVAFGVAGGLLGVGLGSSLFGRPAFPLDFSLLFGAAFGMAYRTRQGECGTWWDGLREGVRGGIIFAVVFGLEEAGFLFFNQYPGGELQVALVMAGRRFVVVAWQTTLYFAIPFLIFYLGLLWYPLEVLWTAALYGQARRNPSRGPALAERLPARYDRLIKLPLPLSHQVATIAAGERP